MNDNDYPFFDYFNKGKRAGWSDVKAYWYAITEDTVRPDGTPLADGEPRPDGMCWHPQFAAIQVYLGQDFERQCEVCGATLSSREVRKKNRDGTSELRVVYKAPPVKICTWSKGGAKLMMSMARG